MYYPRLPEEQDADASLPQSEFLNTDVECWWEDNEERRNNIQLLIDIAWIILYIVLFFIFLKVVLPCL